MIVLVGKSGSGKSTLEYMLLDHDYSKIISYTTRPIRNNETDGEHYHFITREKFQELDSQDFFAESVTYNGHFYAAAKKDCTDNKVIVVELDGLKQLKKNLTCFISFYIDVDVETRFLRMKNDNRGSSLSDILSRIENDAIAFLGVEKEVDHVIKNISLAACIEQIVALTECKNCR